MKIQQLQEIMQQLRFTSDLSAEEQQQLAAISRYEDFSRNETVFTEGTEHRDLYIILSGRVEICMTIPARGCLPVLTLEEGDLVGWSSFLKQGEMTATGIAVEQTRVIAIDAAALAEVCEQDHDIGYQIMRRVALSLSQRLVASRLQVLDMYAVSDEAHTLKRGGTHE